MCQSDKRWFDLLSFYEIQKSMGAYELQTKRANQKLDLIKKSAVKSVSDQRVRITILDE